MKNSRASDLMVRFSKAEFVDCKKRIYLIIIDDSQILVVVMKWNM